jgi:DNA-binding PadR family transcriptional regulator
MTPSRGGRRGYRPEWPDGPGGFPGGPGGGRGPRGGDHRGGPRGGRSGSEFESPDFDDGERHGPGPHRGGGGRRRHRARGDVRAAILLLLEEQPRHGYDLIQEITERSAGSWTPSPGSIYPTLQILEDEGLVAIENVDGRKMGSLTPTGTAHVDANRAALGTPWSTAGDVGPDLAIRKEILALKDAAAQVVRVGTPAQYTAATTVLATARKELYRILAGDDDATPATPSA